MSGKRARLLALVAVAGLMAGVLASSLPAARAGSRRPGPRAAAGPRVTAPAGPAKADRNGDRVFDDLRARLDQTAADAPVDVIVRLDGAPTAQRLARLERAVGPVSVRRRFPSLDAFAARMTRRQVEALARRPEVASLEGDAVVRALNDSAQSSFGVTKARTDDPALDGDGDGNPDAYTRDDLVAAVIDTGIDAGHRDLDEGKVLAFKDFVGARSAPYDDNGHGTHVAATLAGEGDARADLLYRGVAPGAALVGVKVLDATGRGLTSSVVAGIDWVIANRAAYNIKVINLSLGSATCSDGTDLASAAVDRAQAAGLVVAVAAGNEGPGTCTIGAPAAARGALTVGAMADSGAGGFYQAYFSSRGRTLDGRVKPDVSAPGVDITSAQSDTTAGYVSRSGTSTAAPFVAGTALLMLDANPALSAAQVADRITSTAVDWGRGGDNRTVGSRGPDIDYGAGRLDAYAALRDAGAPLIAPPPAPAHVLQEGSLSATGDRLDYPVAVTDTRFPIAATLILSDLTTGTSTSTDFDLVLLDPGGNEVGAARTIDRQEDVSFQPATTGTYTLRVLSFAGQGPFFLDVSGGQAVETTPPETTIDSGPSASTSDPTPTFTFSSEPGASFECRVDSELFGPCASPYTTAELADGPHTVAVRAIDAVGNVDPTPATRSFTVAGSPPAALSLPATGVGPDGATLNATVDPRGRATVVSFEYGTSTAYGVRIRASGLDGGAAESPVAAQLGGLLPATTYHYRVVAVNSSGSAVGTDETFTTAPAPVPAPAPGGGAGGGGAAAGGGAGGGGAAAGGGAGRGGAAARRDTTAPRGSIRLKRTLTITSLVKRGLSARVGSNERGAVSEELTISRATSRRLGLKGRTLIGSASGAFGAPGKLSLRLKLAKSARKRLAGSATTLEATLTTRVVDAAGNKSTLVTTLTLTR